MTTSISPTGITANALVGVTSALVIAANPSRIGLYVFNTNAAVTIWVCPATGPQTPLAAGGTPLAAAIGGAGSIPIQPLQGLMLGPPTLPSFLNGLNAICNTPATPLTIWEFYQ